MPDPDNSLGVLIQRGDPAILEALRIGGVENLEVVTIELGDAVIRARPEIAFSGLQERRDRVSIANSLVKSAVAAKTGEAFAGPRKTAVDSIPARKFLKLWQGI
jgi:hypothetical protein